ncbi:MAG TPA: hypothetical protein VF719_06220 [Abditibacteriaceae bacterium]
MRRIVCLAVASSSFAMPLQAQESLAGVGAATGIAAGMGATAATSVRPGEATRNVGVPNMPDAEGAAQVTNAGPGGGTTVTTTVIRTQPVRFTTQTGQTFLNELLSPRAGARPIPERQNLTARQRSAYSRRVSRMSAAQRKRAVLSKYNVPAVSWQAFYLPQDRYKFGKVWQYVSIEDDSGAYPVRYYYRPWSRSMLNLLSRTPRGSQPRYNRVIGFRTWQDAMLAGYRPDPISRPAPANDLVYIARLSRGPELARYMEYIYSGQVSPAVFSTSVTYIRRVETVVNSRPDTRRLMSQTIAQILGAIIGENELPQSVGGSGRVVTVTTQPGVQNSGSTEEQRARAELMAQEAARRR